MNATEEVLGRLMDMSGGFVPCDHVKFAKRDFVADACWPIQPICDVIFSIHF